MKRRQEERHVHDSSKNGDAPSEGTPVEDIDYGDLEGTRRSVPRSALNRNVDPSEYARMGREAARSRIEVPPDVRFEDGYRIAAAARKRSVLPAVTEGERHSFRYYTNNGFKDVNGVLREGEPYRIRANWGQEGGKGVLDDVKNLDRAISETTSPALKLYRGCDVDVEFPGLRTAKPGREFTSPSYTSTTVSEKFAHDFSVQDVVEIRFPGGKGGGILLGDMSKWLAEYEFLLKRGAMFRLVRSTKGRNKRYVSEVVP
ncbi:MAG: hypothetical protein LBS92_06495 [Candidatus Methanoplasma sp.]|jgi:hypothetical protein|nr:hypothetical protein [Candidatus Methanoplasma sp.]